MFTTYLTTKGQDLLTSSIVDTKEVEFTSVEAGIGTQADPASAEHVATKKATFAIKEVTRNGADVVITVIIANELITQGFALREMGLMATDGTSEPVMISYMTASNPQYIPAYSDGPVNTTFDINMRLTDSEVMIKPTFEEGIYQTSTDDRLLDPSKKVVDALNTLFSKAFVKVVVEDKGDTKDLVFKGLNNTEIGRVEVPATGGSGETPTATVVVTEDTDTSYKVKITIGDTEVTTPNLLGPQGVPGSKGDPGNDGANGVDGLQGASAYDVWLSEGNTGTEADYLISLKGDKGDKGDAFTYTDFTVEQIAALKGETGETGLPGTPGEQGEPGANGLSAYEVATSNGFSGTEAEWLTSLQGEQGEQGLPGESVTGPDGKSAYQVAQENGFSGTEEEWLVSLSGEDGVDGLDGQSAYEVAFANGFVGTEEEWLLSLKGEKGDKGEPGEGIGVPGEDGKSAYQVAVDNGFIGTEPEWLDSLIGQQGPAGANGLSAYELAVAKGFTGTENEYLASLKGEKGDSFAIKKTYISYEEMEADTSESILVGDLLLISTTDTTLEDNGKLYVKTDIGFNFLVDMSVQGNSIQGEPGTNGLNGEDGKSAYELAVESGYAGTEEEWLISLKGDKGETGNAFTYEDFTPEQLLALKGDKGDTGNDGLQGEAGTDGTNGLSAYDIAVEAGFVGTEEEWLLTLVGPEGPKGEDGTNGTNGTNGEAGASAYEIAVENGFVGTSAEWLASLQGTQGEQGEPGTNGTNGSQGASAYDVAVTNGFIGTEIEWLASLKGEQGEQGEPAPEVTPNPDGKKSFLISDAVDNIVTITHSFNCLCISQAFRNNAMILATEIINFDDNTIKLDVSGLPEDGEYYVLLYPTGIKI